MKTRGRTIWADQLDPRERLGLDPGVPESLARRPDVLVVGGGILGVATAVACRDAGIGSVLLIEAQAGLGSHRWCRGPAGSRVASRQRPARAGGARPVRPGPVAGPRRRGDRGGGVSRPRLVRPGPTPRRLRGRPAAVNGMARCRAGRAASARPEAGRRSRTDPAPGAGQSAARSESALGPDSQVATGCTATAVGTYKGRVRSVSTSAGTIAPARSSSPPGGPPAARRAGPAAAGRPGQGPPGGHPAGLPSRARDGRPLATQIEGHCLLAGGTLDPDDTTAGVRADITARIQSDLAAALPPLGRVRLTHRWCCWRPRHPDGLAVIDTVPGLSNAWITSGHYRTGILLAPAAGAALASWITTQRRPGYLQPWGMTRSSMTMDRPGGAASEGTV